MRHVWVLLLLCISGSLCTGGCIANIPLPLADPIVPPTDPPGDVMIHVPGSSGDTVFDRAWTHAVIDGGLNVTLESFEWTTPDNRHLKALRAVERNRQAAKPLADRITVLARSNRSRRIIVTSQSGGPMIAVWALEYLPPDVQIDTLVMLSPAMSPTYDLTKALSRVRRSAYVFTSPHDWIYLGLGTRLVGLMDGVKGIGAGLVGFQRPPGGDPAQYAKLVLFKHQLAWVRYGNFGHHTGALTTFFGRNVVSPLLQTGMLPQ